MNIKDIEKRLKVLVDLCNDTEPTLNEMEDMKNDPDSSVEFGELFTEDMLTARDLYYKVRDEDVHSKRESTDIMRRANTIWKQRNHIKKVGWTQFYGIEGTCIDLIKQGQKINAIKHYRQNKIDKGEEVSLREAKEYIDSLIVKHAINSL